MTRLHIGCADIKLDGYINIDTRQTKATDIVADAWSLEMFESGTVSEVYSRHTIEHLEPDDAVRAIREWHRVLSPTGFARIICPDLEFHAKQYIGKARSTVHVDQRVHAMAGFYGWRVPSRGGNIHDAHRWGYCEKSLSTICKELGFTSITRITHGKDGEPWHLHIVARKQPEKLIGNNANCISKWLKSITG